MLLLVSCQGNVVYHHYEPVDGQGWSQSDTLRFHLPPAPHTGTYHLQLALRYGPDFPYCNVAVVAALSAPRADTLLIPLASSDGKPLGRGVGLLHTAVPLATLHLHQGDHPTVTLHHIMRREILPSIREVGIRMTAEE